MAKEKPDDGERQEQQSQEQSQQAVHEQSSDLARGQPKNETSPQPSAAEHAKLETSSSSASAGVPVSAHDLSGALNMTAAQLQQVTAAQAQALAQAAAAAMASSGSAHPNLFAHTDTTSSSMSSSITASIGGDANPAAVQLSDGTPITQLTAEMLKRELINQKV